MISELARAKVRARIEQGMVESVVIIRPGNGGRGHYDPVTLRETGIANPTTVYTGIARARLVTPSGSVSIGEGSLQARQCTVSIPYRPPQPDDPPDVDPQVDDVLSFTTATDARMTTFSWRVIGVSGGGSWASHRELSCSSLAPSSFWDARA